MATNTNTYDRRINLYINGKEVQNDIKSISKEYQKARNELAGMTRGSEQYNAKLKELRSLKGIIKEHNDAINSSGGAFARLKASASTGMGLIAAGIAGIAAAYNSAKFFIESTDELADKVEVTLGGWKNGILAVGRAIATMNFKDFTKNIKSAIEEGRRYAENLDQIDEKTRALRIAEAEASNEILKQTEISRSATYSKAQQLEAGKKIIKLEEDLTKIRMGISNQAYLNESKNIQDATKLTEEEILAFARREEQMVANIEVGKAYNQMITDRDKLQIITLQGIKLTDEQSARYKELNKAISEASEKTKRFAIAAAAMPGDEKMQLFVDKYVAYQQAIGSGLENTMRTRVRVAKNEDALNDQAIKGAEKVAKSKEETELESFLQTMEINDDVQEVIDKTDKAYFDKLEKKKKADEEYQQARREKEIEAEKEQEEWIEREIKRMEDEAEERKRIEQDVFDAKQNLFNGAVELGSVLFDRQASKLEAQYKKDIAAAGNNAAAKAKIEEDYNKKKNAIARKAAIVEKAAALFSIAVNTAKAIMAVAPNIILMALVGATGVLEAASVAAKPIPQFFTGGYTSKGNKKEVAGLVHKGEYVVPADIVASPRTAPIIRALEEYRVNRLPGYEAGGLVASGSDKPLKTGGGSSPAQITSDPELKILIRQNTMLLAALRKEGVNMKFGYIEADNVRKGMDKLVEIEDSVTM